MIPLINNDSRARENNEVVIICPDISILPIKKILYYILNTRQHDDSQGTQDQCWKEHWWPRAHTLRQLWGVFHDPQMVPSYVSRFAMIISYKYEVYGFSHLNIAGWWF